MRRVAAGRFIGIAMVALAWAWPARGYFGRIVYPCVETLVGYADSIVVGKVISVGPVRGSQGVAVVVEVTEVLKGSQTGAEIRTLLADGQAWEQCRKRGGEVVVFRSEKGREGLFGGDFGGAVVVNERLAFYDLTRRHDNTFDLRMRRLEDPAEILASVKAAAQFELKSPSPPLGTSWNWVSLSLPAMRPAAAEVLLPLDERTQAAAEEWEKSADPDWRVMAIRAAVPLDTKRSRALIERLLEDPAYVVEDMQGWDSRIDWRRRRIYFVRQAAWEARPSGTPRTGTVLEGPDVGFYAPPRTRVWVGLGVGLTVILAGAILAGRRRRSWGLAVAVVCLGLCLATSWAWWRSWRSADAVSFVTARSEHELVSQHGRLSWLRVHDEPRPRGVMIRSARVGGGERPWFLPHLAADVLRERPGVSASSGKTASPGAGVAAYPYHLLQVRYLLIVGVMAAWPVVFAAMTIVRRLRRRLWTSMGKCARCGYDVRWGQGNCPECGALLPFATSAH